MFVKPDESEETLRVTKEVQKRAEEKYKVLENKMKNAEAEREKELKAAQQKLNTAKAKADAFNKKLKQKQQVSWTSVVEMLEETALNNNLIMFGVFFSAYSLICVYF